LRPTSEGAEEDGEDADQTPPPAEADQSETPAAGAAAAQTRRSERREPPRPSEPDRGDPEPAEPERRDPEHREPARREPGRERPERRDPPEHDEEPEAESGDEGDAETLTEGGAEGGADAGPRRTRSRSRRSRGGARGGGGAGRSREPEADEDEGDDDLTFDHSYQEIARISQEIATAPERSSAVSYERKIALFCDLENVALGVRDSDVKKFDIHLVLERLLEKGKIIVKKAYCDWERYSDYKRPFHEAAIEMIDIPQRYYSGKNSADIKMVVDAMDLSYSKEHLDTFALLSGDSDFSPLVSKLKENNKYVIGIGVKNASSNLLIDNCDEFIYYEDVWRDRQKAPKLAGGLNKKNTEAFSLMIDAIQALVRENKDVLWGSMIKQTMQRKKPSFNEGYYGYGSFSELLEDAERNNIIKLKKDRRSGTYIVTGFASRKTA
jgi:uncharacterized protein (TIGR00288 family)